MSTLSREEKNRILHTLEVDREFRYAIMGLIGFKEILDRIISLENRFIKLEERQQKLEERQQKLEERFVRLEERFIRIEERQQKLEERFAKIEERIVGLEERIVKLEERIVKLEERQQRLEERIIRLEERFAGLEERFLRIEEEMRETRRILTVIAHRFGVLTESSFREAMKYVVQEVFGIAEVRKWIHRDERGMVYGYPSTIEVDVIIKDREHILMEIKSRVSRSDVAELARIGKLYEEVVGIKPKMAIIGGFIDADAYEAAVKLGVEIKPAVRE